MFDVLFIQKAVGCRQHKAPPRLSTAICPVCFQTTVYVQQWSSFGRDNNNESIYFYFFRFCCFYRFLIFIFDADLILQQFVVQQSARDPFLSTYAGAFPAMRFSMPRLGVGPSLHLSEGICQYQPSYALWPIVTAVIPRAQPYAKM